MVLDGYLVRGKDRMGGTVADEVELEGCERVVVTGVEVLEFGKALQRAGWQAPPSRSG